jgi:hemolysin III
MPSPASAPSADFIRPDNEILLMAQLSGYSEEVVNALTHGLGVLASIAGGAVVITLAARGGDLWQLGGIIVYSVSLVLLYSASTLYHAVQHRIRKSRLRMLDHCAIYLLIAGTYTPFLVGTLRGAWAWTLLGAVWSLALGGIVYKLFLLGRFPRLSTATYLALGWLGLAALPIMWSALSVAALLWLLAGGLAYTVGTLFFHNRRIRYAHAIWHSFVLLGSGCHFVAVLLQILPVS